MLRHCTSLLIRKRVRLRRRSRRCDRRGELRKRHRFGRVYLWKQRQRNQTASRASSRYLLSSRRREIPRSVRDTDCSCAGSGLCRQTVLRTVKRGWSSGRSTRQSNLSRETRRRVACTASRDARRTCMCRAGTCECVTTVVRVMHSRVPTTTWRRRWSCSCMTCRCSFMFFL